jgi:patatin-like phospholipase/acyl hydrolase
MLVCFEKFESIWGETMLDINPAGKKMILSIDGGGLRGMIAVAMLAELEAVTGKTCPELFDMVAGTSTGAIIAAGIRLGYSADWLLTNVYRTRLPEAFRQQPGRYPPLSALFAARPAQPV